MFRVYLKREGGTGAGRVANTHPSQLSEWLSLASAHPSLATLKAGNITS